MKIRRLARFVFTCLAAGALAAACSGPATLDPATATARPVIVHPTAAPKGGATPAATLTPSGSPIATGQLRLVLAPSGNAARYRVSITLANTKVPTDAVGSTTAVKGMLVIRQDGTIVSENSKITVDLTGLKGDNFQRDLYVQTSLLQTRLYPNAEFVPTETVGLPLPPPTSGSIDFQLVGLLTLHDVTRPVTWTVVASAGNGVELVGTGSTSFAFADFHLAQPRTPLVASIEDKITLELDFRLHITN